MPEYAYLAADTNGSVVKGTKFANNELELGVAIRSSGLHLLEYREAPSRRLRKSLSEISVGGVGRSTLIEFSNNMGVMFRAGVPLINSIEEIRADADSGYFKKILGQVIAGIRGGDTLSEAMAKRPRVFPPLYTNVIQIGESTGTLDTVFFDLAKHYKRIDDLIKSVRKAMIYPIFVVIALLGAGFVFLTMVFPPLFQLLEDFKVPLPTVTKVVMGVSKAINQHTYLILAVVVGVAVIFFLMRQNKTTRYYLDWLELNIPGIRGVFIQLRLAFFMRYLSMLLSAGMDILRGLKLSIESVNNLVIQRYLTFSRERVIEGDLLSQALRKVRYVPNMVSRMVAIGEEAGNLPDQMEYVADHYNEELERRIASALAMLEPILLVCLAALALTLVMGVLLPLYNLVSTLSGSVGGGG